jgi:hypothetical protein
MTHLGAWLAIASMISWRWRHRPAVSVAVALVVWTLVPATSAYRIVGATAGPLAAHPATWLVLVQLGVFMLSDPWRLGSTVDRHLFLSIFIPIFTVSAVAMSVLNGYSGLRLLLDQIVGPAAAFFIVVSASREGASVAPLLRNTIVGLAAFESVLAFVQSRVGSVLWFNPERFDRWMGTTDSPLVLSLLIVIAAPLTVGFRNSALRFATLMVLALGVISSQSRVGVAMISAVVIYLLVRGKMGLVTRILSLFVVVVTARQLLQSNLVSGVSSRLSNDSGSSAARNRAFDLFIGELDWISWVGRGLTSNYQVAAEGGLLTSFESSFLMYAVDVGLPLALLYFGTQFAVILWHAPGNRVGGAFLGALLGAVCQHTFSALGFSNLSGFVIWCAMALEIIGSTRYDHVQELRHAPARRSALTSASV